ncbi:MAG: oligopeptide transporter, OPT family [Gammaproteobacteria bacterium]|nr:oligopeptide transporter, OPT family [Gammaproteobacteria bacterium]
MDAARTSASGAELTARGLILGALITVVFTAANVYFGLKAGLTFATSIPAAVLSMALLRGARGATIRENNIVQTVASAAGTLSAIIFVLPGLVMIGWWRGFPYWTTFAICAFGGVLGVMYSIPLRRALVTGSDLPYPEGVACAEVLKIGAHEGATPESGVTADRSRAGLRAVVVGSLVSAGFAVIIGTRLFAGDVARYFRIGSGGALSGYDFSLSFALFAVGHLVGLWVGLAMLLGALLAWLGLVPWYATLHPAAGAAATVAQGVWSAQVRFVGAGAIGISAVWTLGTLVRPVAAGLRAAAAASRARRAGRGGDLPRIERDIPIGLVALSTLVCLVPIAWLLGAFSRESGLGAELGVLVVAGVAYVVLMSFFVSAVCGYMAGLIGASNSPLSGVGILVVIGAALLLALGIEPRLPVADGRALVAFALFVTSVIFAVATIANNNLQDLKTGQLVDATPWRQQVALVIGVVMGAAVIPPVLGLLNRAYGFAGAPGADPARALPAPQANLIAALAQGVLQRNIDWSLIGVGVAIGAVVIGLDFVLRRLTRGASLPPLAVGLGIYLPTSTTLMVVVGAVAGHWFDRRAARGPTPEATQQLGVLLASGLIVGESLVGVALAALVVVSGKAMPLALVGDGFAGASVWLGALVFAGAIYALYRWIGAMRV